MGQFSDFIDEVESVNPHERSGAGALNQEVILEVKKIEMKDTKDGMGKMVEFELRVGSKPYNGRKVFDRFFIRTTDETKQKGARIGMKNFKQMVSACGFVSANEHERTDDENKALLAGLAKIVDWNTFDVSELVGKFFQGMVKTEKRFPDDEKEYPRLKYSRIIDADQYAAVLASCDFSRNDDDSSDVPPF